MNSHQRRKASRRAHMELPLSKQVIVTRLVYREVYVYRLGRTERLWPEQMREIVGARVSRHIFGKHTTRTGEWNATDVTLEMKNGQEIVVKTNPRLLRLADKADCAPRPWWVQMRRNNTLRQQ